MMEYRSKQQWRGIPVVAVSLSGRAIGIIAVGRTAVGIVSVGLVSAGPVSVGLVTLGVVSLGLVAVGVVARGRVGGGHHRCRSGCSRTSRGGSGPLALM